MSYFRAQVKPICKRDAEVEPRLIIVGASGKTIESLLGGATVLVFLLYRKLGLLALPLRAKLSIAIPVLFTVVLWRNKLAGPDKFGIKKITVAFVAGWASIP